MEMIPKILVLEAIKQIIKIDKEVMEKKITEDKTPPETSDIMRMTQQKTESTIDCITNIITKMKGDSMNNKDICNGCLKLAKQQVIVTEKMVTASQSTLDMAKLLERLTDRVKKLEKQVELVGRRN